jgi:signal transduction histidine kinase
MIATQNEAILIHYTSLFFRRFFISTLLLCWVIIGFSQTLGRTVPEMLEEYRQAKNDSVRIATLSSLASGYAFVNLDSAFLLGELALEQAQLGNFKYLEANAYISIGEVYDISRQFEPALQNINKGLALFEKMNSDKGLARAYNARGLARFYAGRDLVQATKDFETSKKLSFTIDDKVQVAKIGHNLGQIYHAEEDYPAALTNYLLARNLKDSLLLLKHPEITIRDMISTYNNLGAFYNTIYQFEKARETLRKGLEITPEEDYRRRSVLLYTLATVEERDSNYNEALVYLQESLSFAKKGNFTADMPNIYDVMGHSYLMLKSREAASDHFTMALEILNTSHPNPNVKVGVLAHQGEFFFQQGSYYEAIANADEAFSIINANDNILKENIRDAYEVKAKATNALGDFKSAAFYFKKFAEISKEIESTEHKKQYVGLQAIYDVELAEQKYQQKILELEVAFYRKWLIGLAIALSLLVLLAILLALAKTRETNAKKKVIVTNKELEVKNIELASTNQKLNLANSKLSQFSFATGHDLKESLRNITSFTQLASIELAENPPQAQVHLQEAATSGKRMRKMLDDLLHYSNLGGNDTAISRFPLDEAIGSVKQQLKTEIEEARGDVLLTTPATLKANRTEVEQIFFNLVHNAINYQAPGNEPRITIKLEERDDKLVFMVCDNGIGIPAEHQKDIFKPFIRLHNRSKSGSGLGLSICKTIVESYDGTIWYESADNGGSCFCFTLPKSEPKAQLNPNIFIP